MSANITNLFIDTFAYLYESDAKARALLRRSDIDTSSVDFKGNANVLWSNISLVLEKQNKKLQLIETALEEYEEDDKLMLLKNELGGKLDITVLKSDAEKIAFTLQEYGFSSSYKYLIDFQINASHYIREK